MKHQTLKTLALTTAVATVGLGLVGQDALADSVAEPLTASSDQMKPVTADQVASAKEVAIRAQAEADTASQELTSAQTAYEDSKKALSEADKGVAEAQAVDSSLEAKKQAEAEMKEAQAQVAEQEKTVSQAQAEVKTQAQAVTDQKADLKNASNDLTKAKAQAETDARELEAIRTSLDANSLANAQKNVETATADVVKAEKDVTLASEAVKTAEAKDAKLASDLANAKSDVEKAETTVEAKYAELDKAQDSVVTANASLNKAKSELSEATKGQASWDIQINMADEIAKAIKDLTNPSDKTAYQAAEKVISDYLDTIPNDQYIEHFDKVIDVKITADNTVYTVGQLPEDVRKNMNLFYVDVVNAIRRRVGLPEAVASDIMMKHAELKAELYAEKYGDLTIDRGLYHDRDIINKADSQYNIVNGTWENQGQWFIGTPGNYSHNGTITQLFDIIKAEIFMMTLMDSNSNYGHLRGTLEPETLGLALYSGIDAIKNPKVLLLTSGASSESTPDILKRLNPTEYNRRVAMNESIKVPITLNQVDTTALKSKVAIATTALKASEEKLAESESGLAKAQTALKDAQNRYNDLAKTSSDLTPTKANLVKAEQALQTAKVKQATAVETLNLVKTSSENHALLVVKAQEKANASAEALKEAQKAFDLADAKLVTAEMEYDKAKADLATAEAKLSEYKADVLKAQAKVDAIVNASENLAKAKDALAKAQAIETTAKGKLEEAKALYAKEQAEADKAQKLYDSLRIQYELQTRTEEPTTPVTSVEDKKPTIPNVPEKQNEQTKPISSAKEAVKPLASKPLAQPVASLQAKANYSRVARQAQLPETGEKASLFALLGFSILALVGISRKGKHQA